MISNGFFTYDKNGKKCKFPRGSDVRELMAEYGMPDDFIEAHNLVGNGLVVAPSGGGAGSPPDNPKKPAKKAK